MARRCCDTSGIRTRASQTILTCVVLFARLKLAWLRLTGCEPHPSQPALYASLLFLSRRAILSGQPDALSRAIRFLTGDYSLHAFWFEPVDILRKLSLTGAIVLIPDSADLGRVLAALMVSLAFLTLHLSLKPYVRPADNSLVTLLQLALLLVYLSVLLLKVCYASAHTCASFGFGSSGVGVYLLLVFFSLGLVLFLLALAVAHLYLTGNVPRFILIAREHSISPSVLLWRVAVRRVSRLRQLLCHSLGLDTLGLAPRAALRAYSWRSRRRLKPRSITPQKLLPLEAGATTELHIEGVFPRTTCFVQVDLAAFCIRWTQHDSISIHLVVEVATAPVHVEE